MKKSKKITYGLIGLVSIASVSAITLSSCTPSNSNPYAPYTALSANYGEYLRYETSTNMTSYYNSSDLFGKENANQYLSSKKIKEYYGQKSQELVETTLKNPNYWNAIKSLYGDDVANDVTKDKYYETLQNQKQEKPYFFYGVSPTKELVEIANIYNSVNVMNDIYTSIHHLINSLLTYAIHANSQSINDLKFNSVSDFRDQWLYNSPANEFIFAEYCTVGQGNNIYQIWPSGLSFECTNKPTNSNKNIGILPDDPNYATNIELGDIGAPYPLAEYNILNDGIQTINNQIQLTNIRVNFSWFKIERNGGDYVNLQTVNDSLTPENVDMLKKVGQATGKVSMQSFSLPISNLTFNIIPEIYSYQNPWYSGIYNTVYTGLYNVSPTIINNPTSDIKAESYKTYQYPNSLTTSIGANNKKVNWRGIVNVKNNDPKNLKDFINSETWNAISNVQNLKLIPYYQSNLALIRKNDAETYMINLNNKNISFESMYELNDKLFLDPLNKSDKVSHSAIFNNVNNLEKFNALNLYGLALIVDKDVTDITNNIEFNKFKDKLEFGNSKVSAINVAKNDPTFIKGQEYFNEIIKIKNIEKGINLKFNSNGISPKPEKPIVPTPDPNPVTPPADTNLPNQNVDGTQNRKND